MADQALSALQRFALRPVQPDGVMLSSSTAYHHRRRSITQHEHRPFLESTLHTTAGHKQGDGRYRVVEEATLIRQRTCQFVHSYHVLMRALLHYFRWIQASPVHTMSEGDMQLYFEGKCHRCISHIPEFISTSNVATPTTPTAHLLALCCFSDLFDKAY